MGRIGEFIKNLKLNTNTKILIGILAVAFILRIYNLNYNSPFIDEAQYIVLGQKVWIGEWKETAPFSWVGGLPLLYPPLVAVFGAFGIVGARVLNVILGTLSVWLIYVLAREIPFTKSTKNRDGVGLFTAAFFSILTVPIYLSRLATYDMLSYTLFLCSLILLQRGTHLLKPHPWLRENYFFGAAIFIVLSFLAKYTAVMYVPFLVLYGMVQLRHNPVAGKAFVRYFLLPITIIISGYVAFNLTALLHFWSNYQLGNETSQRMEIIAEFITYSSEGMILAFIAVIAGLSRGFNLKTLWFLAGFLVVPIVHILTNSSSTLVQHTFLSMIFLAPFAGYFLSRLWLAHTPVGRSLCCVILLGSFYYSHNLIKPLETAWTNTDAVMRSVRSIAKPEMQIFSVEDDITVLALPKVPYGQITGPFGFSYAGLEDSDAYQKAVADGYFQLIILNDESNRELTNAIKHVISTHYVQVYNVYPFLVYQRQY